jgi:hypothetical protein
MTTKAKPTHCPECHVSLEGRDPLKHSYKHWPSGRNAPPMSEEAQRRARSLGRTDKFE